MYAWTNYPPATLYMEAVVPIAKRERACDLCSNIESTSFYTLRRAITGHWWSQMTLYLTGVTDFDMKRDSMLRWGPCADIRPMWIPYQIGNVFLFSRSGGLDELDVCINESISAGLGPEKLSNSQTSYIINRHDILILVLCNDSNMNQCHYSDIIMGAMASQISSLTRASNAEKVSIRWRHHVYVSLGRTPAVYFVHPSTKKL